MFPVGKEARLWSFGVSGEKKKQKKQFQALLGSFSAL